MIGRFGRVEAFSFHATKFLHTFEGGALVTDDAGLAAKARAMRNFGFVGHEQTVGVGINAKMHEISAAMGLTGLETFDDVVAWNSRNYQRYQRDLDGLPGVSVLRLDERERCNFQYVVAEVDAAIAGISRDELLAVLQAENVLARRYFYPGCHRLAPYAGAEPDATWRLPVTEALAERVLVLPTGTAVSPDDVGAICEILRLAVEQAADLRNYLPLVATTTR